MRSKKEYSLIFKLITLSAQFKKKIKYQFALSMVKKENSSKSAKSEIYESVKSEGPILINEELNLKLNLEK